VTDDEMQTAVLATVIALLSIETRKGKKDILRLCIKLARRRQKRSNNIGNSSIVEGFSE
jgi:hypothetical protein